MTTFEDLGLSARMLAVVDQMGYREPTPVQAQAIPAVLSGRDVIAAAKTGTGKTAAFSLPGMDRLGHARHGQGPLMLVVTPTRELAMQIQEVCETIAAETGHRVTCVVGGVSDLPQKQELARGTDVLIATPGRLVDLLNQGAADLGQVEVLVLDEADRMLDMGFLPDMRRIVGRCPDSRQTLLFSATIDDAIQKNMAHLLHDPAFVEIAKVGDVADTVDHYIVRVDQRAKNDLLLALLEERGGTRIIVFCRTRHRADNTCRKLRRAGFRAAPIHSDRSQNQRKRALDDFAAGNVDIVVATDVLARGIDVPDVNYVVNLDMPTQPEDYVHRVGRTGRAGVRGFAVSFVTPETEEALRDVEKLIRTSIPEMEVARFDRAASDAAIAAKEVRKLERTDPELAAAAREQQAREKRAARNAAAAAERQAAADERTKAANARKRRRRRKGAGSGSDLAAGAAGGAQGTRPTAAKGDSSADAPAAGRKGVQGSGPKRKRQEGRTAPPSSAKGTEPRKKQQVAGGSDMRPGRSQRALREQQHRRSR